AGAYVPQFIAPDADILVVDDNPMNLTVIKGLLAPTRMFITTAESGEECLEKLRFSDFNVVLLDHMMPGMDGVETVARIREKHPDLPVYALTANATAGGNDFYISKGFNGYLSKPIDTVLLEKTIMKHLPEEIMMKATNEDAVKDLDSLPEDMLWLNDTEGISTEEGIKNSGGVTPYIHSLEMFLDTIDDNAEVIENAFKDGDIKLYTVKVHALKSSARIIGAMELSGICQKLEDAGHNDDRALIDRDTEGMLKLYRAYGEKLKKLKLEEDSGDDDRKDIPEDELKEAYKTLREVVPQMDYDSVEMILEQLKGYRLPDEDRDKMQKLEKLLKLVKWEEMEELLS
ncbi:MAG: response regulator, partial [Lachnospiraceae bacterium]|nr:response regulator [Lachnospiraceae bacterium]